MHQQLTVTPPAVAHEPLKNLDETIALIEPDGGFIFSVYVQIHFTVFRGELFYQPRTDPPASQGVVDTEGRQP